METAGGIGSTGPGGGSRSDRGESSSTVSEGFGARSEWSVAV